jgi:hypothetical protein
MFYTGIPAHSINHFNGGKNQYDFWNYNEYLDHKNFWLIATDPLEGYTAYNEFYVKHYSDRPILHHLEIETDEWLHHLQSGQKASIAAIITNKNSYPISFVDPKYPIGWQIILNRKKPNEAHADVQWIGMPDQLLPGQSARITAEFITPNQPGKNLGYFTAFTPDVPPTYQSNRMRLMIDE